MESIGYHPDEVPYGLSYPAVDFEKQDLQDSVKRVTAKSVKLDYGNRLSVVYPAMVPVDLVPSPRLAEEENKTDCDSCEGTGVVAVEDDDTEECYFCHGSGELSLEYDWSELQMSGRKSIPPAKLKVDKNGKISILDGNHRITYWMANDMELIPAWVVDQRK